MAKDDMARIMYTILKELYETMKDGEPLLVDSIKPQRFNIPDSYWMDIMDELISNGYVKGAKIITVKTGRYITALEDCRITLQGVDFLQSNSIMARVKDALKDIKDIMPGV